MLLSVKDLPQTDDVSHETFIMYTLTDIHIFCNQGYSTDVQQNVELIKVNNNASEYWNDTTVSWNNTQQSPPTAVVEEQTMISSANVETSHNVAAAPAQISVKPGFGYFDNTENSITPQVYM